MRYALTIQEGEGFNSVNTLIIEDNRDESESGKSWKDGDEELIDIIRECGYSKESAEFIVRWRLYFIRCCDDIDFSPTDTLVSESGEEITWGERRENYASKKRKD